MNGVGLTLKTGNTNFIRSTGMVKSLGSHRVLVLELLEGFEESYYPVTGPKEKLKQRVDLENESVRLGITVIKGL